MQRGKIKFREPVKKEWLPELDAILSIITKLATITPLFLICYGAIYLLSFARQHNIMFVDLVKTNIFLSFGAFFLTYSLFLTMIVSITVVSNHMISPIVTKSLLMNSKIKIFTKRRWLPVVILSFLLASWPYVLLITTSWNAILIYFSILSLIFYGYHHFLTVDLHFKKFFTTKRLTGLLLAFSPAISLFSVLVMYDLFSTYIKKNNITEWKAVASVSVVIFIMNFISFHFPLIEKKKGPLPSSIVITLMMCFSFLLLPSPVSSYSTETLIRSLGIGLEKRCYITKEVDTLPIFKNLKTERNDITELFIVANIDNIYYISYPRDINMISQMRFVAEKLTNVSCSSGETPELKD